MASSLTCYKVNIPTSKGGVTNVYTDIADSSHLVNVSLCRLTELMNECIFEIPDNGLVDTEIIGLTIEFCDDNTHQKVATLQLCWGSYGILIQLLHLEEIPESLRKLLASENYIFVGVGIRDACSKLERYYGLKCKSMVELAPVASRVCQKSEFFDASLEVLAREIVGINIVRPAILSLSHWGARDLRFEQINFAMAKAYACYQIGHKVMSGNVKIGS